MLYLFTRLPSIFLVPPKAFIWRYLSFPATKLKLLSTFYIFGCCIYTQIHFARMSGNLNFLDLGCFGSTEKLSRLSINTKTKKKISQHLFSWKTNLFLYIRIFVCDWTLNNTNRKSNANSIRRAVFALVFYLSPLYFPFRTQPPIFSQNEFTCKRKKNEIEETNERRRKKNVVKEVKFKDKVTFVVDFIRHAHSVVFFYDWVVASFLLILYLWQIFWFNFVVLSESFFFLHWQLI